MRQKNPVTNNSTIVEKKKKSLDEIADEIAQTQGDPLKAPEVNPVPGEGNPDAEIMFIGEGPGFNESPL